MNQVPTKIVLKSTTRMSLNDRFSTIVPTVQSIRANKASEHQVSAANRRLAQQLANRPGIPQNQVNNMMMYNNNNMMNNNMNNNNNNMMRGQGRGRRGGVPIQNRVGPGNIKARLTLPNNKMMRGGQGQRGGGGRGGNMNNYNNNNAMTMSPFNKPRGRGALAARSPRGRGALRGGRGQQFNRYPPSARGNNSSGFRRQHQGPPYSRGGRGGLDRFTGQATGRGGPRGGARGGMAANQQAGGVRGGGRGSFNNRGGRYFNNRGGRGGRGRGRGAANGGGGQSSVEDLDSQLDLYMAKTKTSLDTELDAYMAHVTTD